jgi:sterol 3beta-glucosyltransferase
MVSAMHITMITTGTRGDIQPYIAFGIALKSQGHTIRLCTTISFKEQALACGFEFSPLPGDAHEFFASPEAQKLIGSGGIKLTFALISILDKTYAATLDASLQACEGTDAIIFSGLTLAASHIGEAMGVPTFTTSFVPMAPTAAFPPTVLPWHNLGSMLNRAAHFFFERPLWLRYMDQTNQWRKAVLGLPPIPYGGAYNHFNRRRLPWLNAYSSTLVPKATDWPSWMHVTGYWHPNRSSEHWQPPTKLQDFLNAGSPPVFIGFGSMIWGDGANRTRLVVEALQISKTRGLLYQGWGGLLETDLPEGMMFVGDLPHDWLFPRVAAVVHHGGAGTSHSALRSGKPSVVIPFFGDQYYWGRRLSFLGAAPDPIPQNRLTAENLSQAISLATTHPLIHSSASSLGKFLMSEDGVSNAVQIFNQSLEFFI